MPSRSKRTTGKRINVDANDGGGRRGDIRSCSGDRPLPTLALFVARAGGGRPVEAPQENDFFRMPSGNVYCAYEHYSFAPTDLRCEIRSKLKPLPPRPASCRDAVWGAGYSMRQRGPAGVLCITGHGLPPEGGLSLPTARTRQFGVFRCSSSVKGLRCVNSTGNGFFLSKEHSYTYKEPAARYGSFKTPSRNIVCGWTVAPDGSASMECAVKSGLKPPPKPIHCDAGDPNDKRVSLRDTGRADPVLCAGDPGPLLRQDRGEGERPRLRIEHPFRRDHVHVRHDRPHLPQPRGARLLFEPRLLAAPSSSLPSRDRRPRMWRTEGEGRATPTRCCADSRRDTRPGAGVRPLPRVAGAMWWSHDGVVVSAYDERDGLGPSAREYFWTDGNRLDVSTFPALPLNREGGGMQSRVIMSGEPIVFDDVPRSGQGPRRDVLRRRP